MQAGMGAGSPPGQDISFKFTGTAEIEKTKVWTSEAKGIGNSQKTSMLQGEVSWALQVV